jgi:hypothetical protein
MESCSINFGSNYRKLGHSVFDCLAAASPIATNADVRALSARRPKPLRCAVSGLAGANKQPAMSLTIGPHLGVQWQNSGWARAASPVRLLNVTEGQRHDGET